MVAIDTQGECQLDRTIFRINNVHNLANRSHKSGPAKGWYPNAHGAFDCPSQQAHRQGTRLFEPPWLCHTWP